MKKIIGILGMTAALASAAFALDVSASLKIEGSLLNVNEDGKVNALKTNTGTPAYAGLGFTTADEVAGGSFGIGFKDISAMSKDPANGPWEAGSKATIDPKIIDWNATDGKIWVKPFANALNKALTLNVGKVGGLSTGKYGVGGDVGFLADYNNTDIGLNVALVMNSLWYDGQTRTTWGDNDAGNGAVKDENVPNKDNKHVYDDGKLGLFGAKIAYKNDSFGNVGVALSYNDAANKAFQLALGYASAEFVPGLTFGLDFWMQTAEDYRKAVDTPATLDKYYKDGKTVGKYSFFRKDPAGCDFNNKMSIAVNAKYALADLGLTFSTAEEFVFTQDYDEYLRATEFSTKQADDSVENKMALNLVRTSLNVGYAKDLLGLDLGFNADFITASGDNMDKALKAGNFDIDANDKVINEKIFAKFAYKEPKFFSPTVEVAVEGFLGNYGWGKASGADNATYGEDDMTVKINAGVSGKIGMVDWTFGMNNTITNHVTDDSKVDSKNPDEGNDGMKYQLDLPFTMSVAF